LQFFNELTETCSTNS